jgi:hypothetical protein
MTIAIVAESHIFSILTMLDLAAKNFMRSGSSKEKKKKNSHAKQCSKTTAVASSGKPQNIPLSKSLISLLKISWDQGPLREKNKKTLTLQAMQQDHCSCK